MLRSRVSIKTMSRQIETPKLTLRASSNCGVIEGNHLDNYIVFDGKSILLKGNNGSDTYAIQTSNQDQRVVIDNFAEDNETDHLNFDVDFSSLQLGRERNNLTLKGTTETPMPRKLHINRICYTEIRRQVVRSTGLCSTSQIKQLLFDDYRKLGCLNQIMFDVKQQLSNIKELSNIPPAL
jgi:hypothetical protein